MPFPVAGVIGAGSLLLGALKGKPKRARRIDYRPIIDRYLGMKPEGYVTPADQAATERTRGVIAGGVRNAARGRRMRANRFLTARGINTSPAAAATELAIGQDEAAGLESAATTAAGQEYDAYRGNQAFSQGMVARALGLEMGAADAENRRNDERESTFWNSIIGAVPSVLSLFGPGGGAAAGAPGLPATALLEASNYGGPSATFDPRVIRR